MRALQAQYDMPAGPRLWNFNVALKPGGADVMSSRLQPEWNFNISRLTIGFILGRGEIGFIENAARPFCVDVHGIADAVSGERTGQVDGAAKRTVEPAASSSGVFPVEFEAPGTGEVQLISGRERGK